jgi:hypothetical protein
MDRRSLLALFTRRPVAAIGVGPEPEAIVVYEAARAIRQRIDLALAASRLDTPTLRTRR